MTPEITSATKLEAVRDPSMYINPCAYSGIFSGSHVSNDITSVSALRDAVVQFAIVIPSSNRGMVQYKYCQFRLIVKPHGKFE